MTTLALVARDRNLLMTVLGVAFFWAFTTLAVVATLPATATNPAAGSALMLAMFVAGLIAGSVVANRLSSDQIELGLVPVGGFGMGLSCLLVYAASASAGWMTVTMAMAGFAAGWFGAPLHALTQELSPAESRRRVLLLSAGVSVVFAALGWLAYDALARRAGLTMPQIIGVAGVVTLAATAYILTILPDFFVRFMLWMVTHTAYRIKVVGEPNIPKTGPALIIANHISMVDPMLVGATVPRFVRFLMYGPHFRQPGLNWFVRQLHAIPVTAGNRSEVVAAIERARAALVAGQVVCIFVEGAVSRTGNLLPFKRGFERIVGGLDVPVVPVYLDRVWGSVFSYKRGRFFWKLPERLPYPVTVAWGAPLPSSTNALDARLALMELGAEAMKHRRRPSDLLHTEFIRVAKRRWRRFAIADTTGQRLTYGRTLVGSMLLSRLIRRMTEGQRYVGVMLPASAGGAIANIAVLMAHRVPVNLNFTIGAAAVQEAIAEAGIRTIITSRRFLEKAGLAEFPGMVFLEDLRDQISGLSKAATLVTARALPAWMLRRRYGGRGITSESPATVIFSSGSTGVPKGVVLTHANILANVDSLDQIFPMDVSDCFIGVLPFFHSFGFTGTLWFPMLKSCAVAYHPNPMDAKTVGELAATYKARMLISTPTFCNAYLRRCTPEQFAHLKYAIVGAEKLREPLATEFKTRFGIGLLEGYGCTEMSPVVAVNRPNIEKGRETQIGSKAGSVGHPIPGVAAKVVDQDTGDGPVFGRPGLLLVKGPNLMAGYLNQPERTAEVVKDGWYNTNDIAMMDEDGFIFITDRLSRFSKIGGEMVPHMKIEDAINGILGGPVSAVTSVPDPSRGERIVAFYTRTDVSPQDLWEQLTGSELPNLWIPRRECLIPIAEIPTLGTGKVDLRALRELAERGRDSFRRI